MFLVFVLFKIKLSGIVLVTERSVFYSEQSEKTPDWNFWKYLIDDTGKVLNAWGPGSAVEDVLPDVITAIKKAKSVKASMDKIKDALKAAQAKMGDKAGGFKFEIHDDL